MAIQFFRKTKLSVLMVCTANICRSPMAQGMLRTELLRRGLKGRVVVQSAGTHASMPGHRADPRAQQVCLPQGVNLGKLRSRQILTRDFRRSDYILAMDKRNWEWLLDACPEGYQGKISLVGSWGGAAEPYEIPDPYFGNAKSFETVFSLLVPAIVGFAEHLKVQLELPEIE